LPDEIESDSSVILAYVTPSFFHLLQRKRGKYNGC